MRIQEFKLLVWLVRFRVGAALLAICLIIYALHAYGIIDNASSPVIASWVQALGSVAAIWGALRVAQLQITDQKLREHEAALRLLEKTKEENRQEKRKKLIYLQDIFVTCFSHCQSMLITIDHGVLKSKNYTMQSEALLIQIRRLTLSDLPNIELLTDVSNLRIRLQGLHYVLEEVMARPSVDVESVKFQVKEVMKWADVSASTCTKRIEEISSPEETLLLHRHLKDLQNARDLINEK